MGKSIFSRINSLISKVKIYLKWFVCSKKSEYMGVTDRKYDDEIVVSLTSYPARIQYVDKVIISLLLQKMKPNKIILWLSESQFPGREESIPARLLKLKKYGLQILWCEDIKSYKKLIPALRMCPEAVIVTADDDALYREEWLQQLYQTHLKYPDSICAHRITKFLVRDKKYEILAGGFDYWDSPSFLNKPTGVGGILYPRNCFTDEVLKKDIFMGKCATNDDIWFWLMGALNGKKVAPVRNSKSSRILTIRGSQVDSSLSKMNDHGQKLFWKDFDNMLSLYPALDKLLKDEYSDMMKNENQG